MSDADRGQYAETVTALSREQVQTVLSVVEPPVCLLGGWAVHLHVTDGFRQTHGRSYIGSRDIDIGVHVDPDWSASELRTKPVGKTLQRIETGLEFHRGRFGFYRQFHRETGDPLTDEAARDLPAHEIFRVDIDVIPDTTELDTFADTFGFRPPAEPLLSSVFRVDDEPLDEYVSWTAPDEVLIAPPAALAAMKIRAFPERDKSHKRLKDIADLHALLWYVTDYATIRPAVLERVADDDIDRFRTDLSSGLYDQTASLIGVDVSVVEQSIEQLVR
jgi:hypothetical protein